MSLSPPLRLALFFLVSTAVYAQPGSSVFGGPSVLSGDQGSSGGSVRRLFQIRPYLNIGASYTDGLTPAAIDTEGRIPNRSSAGVTASFGAMGYREWKKSRLALSYNGRARHYTRQKTHDGIDQTLALAFQHQPTPRLQLSFNQSAGIYSRSLGLAGLNPADGQAFGFTPNLSSSVSNIPAVPQNDIFDTRTYYLTSSGGLRYNKTARLSFGAYGTGFTVLRHSSALAGVRGVGAGGDIGYRLSRTQTIGIGYAFANYSYTRGFGDANIHSSQIYYTRQLNRRWMAGGSVGAYRLEAVGTQRVRLDPLIAALLGTTTGVEVFHTKTYGTMLSAQLSAQFRNSALNFGYSRGLNPGNGLYLTSQAESIYAAYSYVPIRNWSGGLQAVYTRLSARTQNLGRSEAYIGTASLGRSIFSWMSYGVSASIRRYKIVNGFHRDSYVVTMGLGFSPGEIPISF